MLPKKPCKHCKQINPYHWPYQCKQNPKTKKSINKISDKQKAYHTWLEEKARPYLIAKYDNICNCCHKPATTKLDIEHTKNIGSHASLKKDLNNLTLYCRNCHRNKTDHKICQHKKEPSLINGSYNFPL